MSGFLEQVGVLIKKLFLSGRTLGGSAVRDLSLLIGDRNLVKPLEENDHTVPYYVEIVWCIVDPRAGGFEMLGSPMVCFLRTRGLGKKACDVIHSESCSLRSRRTMVSVLLQGWKMKWNVPAQWGMDKGTDSSSFCLLFSSGPQWIGWCPTTLGRAIYFLSSPVKILILSGNTLIDTTGNHV